MFLDPQAGLLSLFQVVFSTAREFGASTAPQMLELYASSLCCVRALVLFSQANVQRVLSYAPLDLLGHLQHQMRSPFLFPGVKLSADASGPALSLSPVPEEVAGASASGELPPLSSLAVPLGGFSSSTPFLSLPVTPPAFALRASGSGNSDSNSAGGQQSATAFGRRPPPDGSDTRCLEIARVQYELVALVGVLAQLDFVQQQCFVVRLHLRLVQLVHQLANCSANRDAPAPVPILGSSSAPDNDLLGIEHILHHKTVDPFAIRQLLSCSLLETLSLLLCLGVIHLYARTVHQWFSNWGTRVICDTFTKKL